MSPGGLKTIILCLIFQAAQLTSACDFERTSVRSLSIREIEGPDLGVMKSFTVRDSNMTFDAHIHQNGRYLSFNEYFKLSERNNYDGSYTFQLSLAKVINLDWVTDFPRGPKGGLTIRVLFTCTTKNNSQHPVFFNYDLTVLPVDNYPPDIIPYYAFSVREDVPVGHGFANLRDAVRDQDIPDETVMVAFKMYKYGAFVNNGGTTFTVSAKGDISAITPLDYDLDYKYYTIYVDVTNNVSQVSFGIIKINVLNVNDNPVRFKGCLPANCRWTLINYDVHKERRLVAVDPDGEPIEYSIINVIPATETGIMWINKTSGMIRQLRHPNNLKLKCLTLTVKAMTQSNLPIARNKNERDLTSTSYVVDLYFREGSFSTSGSDRVLKNGLFLSSCLITVYGIFMLWFEMKTVKCHI